VVEFRHGVLRRVGRLLSTEAGSGCSQHGFVKISSGLWSGPTNPRFPAAIAADRPPYLLWTVHASESSAVSSRRASAAFAAGAATAAVLGAVIGLPFVARAVLVVAFGVGGAAAVIDVASGRIPNALLATAAAAVIVLTAVQATTTSAEHAERAIVGALVVGVCQWPS
jgi:hypothetical protein